MYADNIVLIAETEDNLQLMLNGLANCCTSNARLVNPTKINIVHFGPQLTGRSLFDFTCCEDSLKTMGHYTYLGLLRDEFLD